MATSVEKETQRLSALVERAQARLSGREELEDLPPKKAQVPLWSSGLVWTAGGAETRRGREEVSLPSSVQGSREFSVSVQEGPYVIELELSAPGEVSVHDGDGNGLVTGKRVWRGVGLEVSGGAFTVQASAPIERASLFRLSGTGFETGEIALGPLRCEGTVSARVVGRGSFETEVASDFVRSGEEVFGPEKPSPALEERRLAQALQERPVEGVPWSRSGAPREALDFGPERECGLAISESAGQASFRETNRWMLGKGKVLSYVDTQLGDNEGPGPFGLHLASSDAPLEGDALAWPRALPEDSGDLTVPMRPFPSGCIVRARGEGLLRAIEVTECVRTPFGRETTRSRRIDLSPFSPSAEGFSEGAPEGSGQLIW